MCALTARDAVTCWGTGLAVGSGDAAGSITRSHVQAVVGLVAVVDECFGWHTRTQHRAAEGPDFGRSDAGDAHVGGVHSSRPNR